MQIGVEIGREPRGNLKAGARSLARQPASAIISVLILALGIGLSTFMFSLVCGVLLRGLDVPEADRVAVLGRVDTREGDQDDDPMPGLDFLDFRERTRSFSGLAGYTGGTVNLADDAAPERYQGAWVTADVFDVLRVAPVLGRTFVAGEDRPGLPPTVVLGYHVWRDRYGLDPGIVGRSVRVNGRQGTIVGVMPDGFRLDADIPLYQIGTVAEAAGARRGSTACSARSSSPSASWRCSWPPWASTASCPSP